MQNVKAYFVSHRMLHKVQEIEETKTKSEKRKKIILRGMAFARAGGAVIKRGVYSPLVLAKARTA